MQVVYNRCAYFIDNLLKLASSTTTLCPMTTYIHLLLVQVFRDMTLTFQLIKLNGIILIILVNPNYAIINKVMSLILINN
jgi:hypothetical protein